MGFVPAAAMPSEKAFQSIVGLSVADLVGSTVSSEQYAYCYCEENVYRLLESLLTSGWIESPPEAGDGELGPAPNRNTTRARSTAELLHQWQSMRKAVVDARRPPPPAMTAIETSDDVDKSRDGPNGFPGDWNVEDDADASDHGSSKPAGIESCVTHERVTSSETPRYRRHGFAVWLSRCNSPGLSSPPAGAVPSGGLPAPPFSAPDSWGEPLPAAWQSAMAIVAGPGPTDIVQWDYHVVALIREERHHGNHADIGHPSSCGIRRMEALCAEVSVSWFVLDCDSKLSSPSSPVSVKRNEERDEIGSPCARTVAIPLEVYIAKAFAVTAKYRPMAKVLGAWEYLATLRSDRSHMLVPTYRSKCWKHEEAHRMVVREGAGSGDQRMVEMSGHPRLSSSSSDAIRKKMNLALASWIDRQPIAGVFAQPPPRWPALLGPSAALPAAWLDGMMTDHLATSPTTTMTPTTQLDWNNVSWFLNMARRVLPPSPVLEWKDEATRSTPVMPATELLRWAEDLSLPPPIIV